MAVTKEDIYSSKIFLNCALPLAKVIATDIPSLGAKFKNTHAVVQVSALDPDAPEGKVATHFVINGLDDWQVHAGRVDRDPHVELQFKSIPALNKFFKGKNSVRGSGIGLAVCDEIVTDSVADADALEAAVNSVAGHTVRVIEPKQGVRRQLLDLSHSNAADALEKYGSREERRLLRTEGAVKQLAELLSLPILPNRIEAYDISHISGTDKVASMVVFEGGEAKKAHYRKFRIKTVEGNNDFACMKEALTRRLMRLKEGEDESFATPPDLILIDGGKGQLAYALEALRECGEEGLEILSLAKREEEVFLGSSPKESILLPKDCVALQLLQRVRDEAHRFAITYHRTLRGKHMSETVLMKVPGIGKERAEELLKAFGSAENVRHASAEDIAALKGFSLASARKLLAALNAQNGDFNDIKEQDKPADVQNDENSGEDKN